MSEHFSEQERAVLRIIQKNLPDSATPYTDIAQEVGLEEAEVLRLLQRLKANGAIRRFGASIKHQRTGWNCNVMVAWIADEALADEAGEQAAKHQRISHCYFRPSTAKDWPYTLFTMIHGRTPEECLAVIEELRKTTRLNEHAMLESLKELKKTSMVYF